MKIKSLIFTAILSIALLCSGGIINAQSVDNSALIAQLQAQIASLMAQIQALQGNQGSTGWCYTFSADFGIGSSGKEVINLLIALDKQDIYDPITVPTSFNEDVAGAVVLFQQKYGIRASGWVGPITRAKLNSLYACAPTNGINGVCGSANGIATTTIPTNGLCATGLSSVVSNNTGLGFWMWSCFGSNGGTTSSCSASTSITNQPTALFSFVSANASYSYNATNPANSVTTGVITFKMQSSGGAIPPLADSNVTVQVCNSSNICTSTGVTKTIQSNPDYMIWDGSTATITVNATATGMSGYVYFKISDIVYVINGTSIHQTTGLENYKTPSVNAYGVTNTTNIIVTSPSGGESWQLGTVQNLMFQITPVGSKEDIYLVSTTCPSGQNCTHPIYIGAGGSLLSTGSTMWGWTVGSVSDSATISPGSYVIKMCVANTTICSTSNSFTITAPTTQPTITVTSPNGGESLTKGQSRTITWHATKYPNNGYVALFLQSSSGNSVGVIKNTFFSPGSPAVESYTWDTNTLSSIGTYPNGTPFPTDFSTGSYKIRAAIIDYSATYGSMAVFDESDNYFTITAPTTNQPVITSINPTQVTKFTDPTITLTGLRFNSSMMVDITGPGADFGAIPLTVSSDGTTMTFKLVNIMSSVANIYTPGAYNISVYQTNNTSIYSNSVVLNIVAPTVTQPTVQLSLVGTPTINYITNPASPANNTAYGVIAFKVAPSGGDISQITSDNVAVQVCNASSTCTSTGVAKTITVSPTRNTILNGTESIVTANVAYTGGSGYIYFKISEIAWTSGSTTTRQTTGLENYKTPSIYTYGAVTAVNGACGTANGITVTTAPTTNLCSVGLASAVSGSGPWTWTCAGSNGGISAPCSAPKTNLTCTDSDGGQDIYTKGNVTGIWDFYTGTDATNPASMTTHSDYCRVNYGYINGLPAGLGEYSCNSNGRKTENYFPCANGCLEGACVRSSAVNGACGTAAKAYPAGSTAFVGTMCATGSIDPINPPFPTTSTSTVWMCLGLNGGAPSSICGATLQPPVTTTPSVKVVSPNGGETLTIGTPYTIKLSSTGDVGNVAVYLVKDNNSCMMYTTSALTTQISYTPTTADSNCFMGYGQYKVQVIKWMQGGGADYSIQDSSDNYFTIAAPTTAPTIASITPTSGRTGSSVVLSGTGFSSTDRVVFGGFDNIGNGYGLTLYPTNVTSTQMTFSVPALMSSSYTGTFTVYVQNINNNISNKVQFAIIAPTTAINYSQSSLASISDALAKIAAQIQALLKR